MSFQPGANLYTAGFGSRPENVEVPHIEKRDPAQSDVNYPIGKRWLNTVSEEEFILYSFSVVSGVTSAVWGTPVGATGPVLTISDTDDIPVFPDAQGDIQFNGNINQIDVSSNPLSHELNFSLTNPLEIQGLTTTGTVILSASSDNNITIGNAGSAFQQTIIDGHDVVIGNNSLPTSVEIEGNIHVGAGSTSIQIGNGSSNTSISGEVIFAEGFTSSGSSAAINPSIFSDTPVSLVSTTGFLTGPVTYNAVGCETVFSCDTTAGAITINLPAILQPGTVFMVYDVSGNASVNNITVNAPLTFNFFQGGLAPFSPFTMSHNYESALFIICTNIYNVMVLSNVTGV